MDDIPSSDPFDLPRQLDALETSIERSFEPGFGFYPQPDAHMDDLGRMLDALEASVEGTLVPHASSEPPVIEPAMEIPLSELPGPRSPDPPLLEETATRSQTGLRPAPATVPFFTPNGLKAPSYRPRLGGSAGTKYQGTSTATRWCPRDNDVKDTDECRECPDWDEDAGECHYEHIA